MTDEDFRSAMSARLSAIESDQKAMLDLLERLTRVEERSVAYQAQLASVQASEISCNNRLSSLEHGKSWVLGLVFGLGIASGVLYWSLAKQLEMFRDLPSAVLDISQRIAHLESAR
jgi:hypothetical protein